MVYHITHLLPNESRKQNCTEAGWCLQECETNAWTTPPQILGIPELAKSTTEPVFSVVFISMVCLLLTVVIYLSLS